MTKTLEINLRNQWKSIKEGFAILATAPLALAIGHVTGKISWNDYPNILIIVGVIYSVLFVPAIFFHITYYLNNRHLKIIFDYDSKTFSLTKNGVTTQYSYSDIIHSEKNLNLYNKNKIDNAMRWSTTWCGYNYIKFRLKDGTLFFITSLMTDILEFDYDCKETHYSLFTPLLERDWKTIDYSGFDHRKNA